MMSNINSEEDQIETNIMEAMLEYLEGKRTFRSVLTLSITSYNKKAAIKNQNIAEVVSQLNFMGNQVARDYKFSREEIKSIFTTMLEKLTKS